MADNKQLALFNQLDDDEKAVLRSILMELSSSGKSDTLNSLWSEDYDEIPVDIDTFLDDKMYFGDVLDGTLYPYWRKMLRHIFSPNAKYFEVIFSCLRANTLLPTSQGTLPLSKIKNLVDSGSNVFLFSLTNPPDDELIPTNLPNNSYPELLPLLNEPASFSTSRISKISMTGCKTSLILHLSNGSSIQSSKDHRFLLANNSWAEAKDLSVNSPLKSPDSSSPIFISSIEYSPVLYPLYDISLDPPYSNFLTSSGVISHNCSIGVGKSTVAGIAMAYILYKLLCLKNPQKFYGLSKSSSITMNFFNVNLSLAETVTFGKFQSMITKSPWFLNHGTLVGKAKPQLIPDKNISLMFGSNASHALGHDVFCLHPNTQILSSSNSSIPISSLSSPSPLTQFNPSNLSLSSSSPASSSISSFSNSLLSISLSDNSSILSSPNHLFLNNSFNFIPASFFKPNDSLILVN